MISAICCRYLRLQILRTRNDIARQLQNVLSRGRNIRVCVRNRLRDFGSRSRMQATALLLTRAHRVTRLARNDGGGSIMIWEGICFEGDIELTVFHRRSLTADRYMRKI